MTCGLFFIFLKKKIKAQSFFFFAATFCRFQQGRVFNCPLKRSLVCAVAILRLNFLKQEVKRKKKEVDTLQLLPLRVVYCDLFSIQTLANYVPKKKERKKISSQ